MTKNLIDQASKLSPVKRWIYRLQNLEYVQHAAKLTLGTTLAQSVNVLVLPLITRLYDSGDYGLAAVFISLVTVTASVSCLRLEPSIILCEERETGLAVRVNLLLAGAAVTVVTLLVGINLLWLRSNYFHVSPHWWMLLPAGVAAAAAYQVLAAWSNRLRRYDLLAWGRIGQPLTYAAILLAAYAWYGSTYSAILIGQVAGLLALVVINGAFLARSMRETLGQVWSREEILPFFRKYAQFPKYNLLMTLLDQGTAVLPVFLFAVWFSPSDAAYFALAVSVLRLPSSLIGQSVSQVFFEKASRLRKDAAELRQFVWRNVRTLGYAAVPFMVMLCVGGPWIFALVFGEPWREAGEFARFMVVAIGLSLVASPISMISAVVEKQHIHLVISVATFAVRVAGLWLGSLQGNALWAVVWYSLGESLMLIVFLIWVFSTLHRSSHD